MKWPLSQGSRRQHWPTLIAVNLHLQVDPELRNGLNERVENSVMAHSLSSVGEIARNHRTRSGTSAQSPGWRAEINACQANNSREPSSRPRKPTENAIFLDCLRQHRSNTPLAVPCQTPSLRGAHISPHCEERGKSRVFARSEATKQSICFVIERGQVAQLVEQRTENPRVGGSIPPLATILFNDLRTAYWLPLFVMCNFCEIVRLQ